ncbi:hypothetical protein ACFPAF_09930 [Hymenobacter endophyticus]|uniref:Uncharacterized protein n=1 Tax=Hymenobacter endophyticus TaxID=3076335 RepID=A0ABU3TH56_9BACT|nr:hypothetical protein [Hymenobacter endophyticus]MDU0370711.1 hypothetical protein [Hymenobacter endophyticus]
MKVLVFPALLAIAIYVSPPKPFAATQTGKEVTARSVASPETLNSAATSAENLSATPQSASKKGLLLPSAENYTARR